MSIFHSICAKQSWSKVYESRSSNLSVLSINIFYACKEWRRKTSDGLSGVNRLMWNLNLQCSLLVFACLHRSYMVFLACRAANKKEFCHVFGLLLVGLQVEHRGMTPVDAYQYVRARRPRVLLATAQWLVSYQLHCLWKLLCGYALVATLHAVHHSYTLMVCRLCRSIAGGYMGWSWHNHCQLYLSPPLLFHRQLRKLPVQNISETATRIWEG